MAATGGVAAGRRDVVAVGGVGCDTNNARPPRAAPSCFASELKAAIEAQARPTRHGMASQSPAHDSPAAPELESKGSSSPLKEKAFPGPVPVISASLPDSAPDHPRIGDAVLTSPVGISHFADGVHPPSVGGAAPPGAGAEAVREVAAWAARSAADAVAKRRSVKLRLDSERLGSVSFDVFVRGTEVTVGFDASGSAMRALLAQGPALAEELASKGLQLIAFLPVGAGGAILRK